jgi:mono/diheme cytochrome c family protein
MPDRIASAGMLSALAVVVAAGAIARAGPGVNPQDFPQVQRGRYLAIVGDCAGCHTLQGSGDQLAGGRPIETPFGKLLAPNVTPDPETGIGAWSDDEFVNSLTKGTGHNGTHLYPAMPYTYMTKTSREDALAIRAYLKTIPAVKNAVQANQLPFPLSVRGGMTEWDALFFKPGAFKPVAGKSDDWNRGAYLTEGLAHCGMCHTPKNELGADKTDEKLQGYALQGWFAPNITNDARRGLGGWSADDIAEYLKTGHNRFSAATGLMAETITLSTSHMTDADLHAIAVYLKDQPGQKEDADKAKAAPDAGTMQMGGRIYADECSGCHAPSGKGSAGLFPSLAGSSTVQQTDATSLMRIVLRGARSTGTNKAPTAPAMPSFGWLLNDDEAAAVLTFVRNSWGNAAPPVTAADVSKSRRDLAQRRD